ncbi:hypothetical protein Moror_6039 [Moniliophthora roreri MCA 2997]|uniref:Uncharacterized protein n=2 Tax=Moniliophthora roreri TaxID=221103 RepID=V2WKQ2_MONRO|nr:hypothetical protein Moror_6039 [Moniliophthora roreri MCA 2997]
MPFGGEQRRERTTVTEGDWGVVNSESGVRIHTAEYGIVNEPNSAEANNEFVHTRINKGDYMAISIDTDFVGKGVTVRSRTGDSGMGNSHHTVNKGNGIVVNNNSTLPEGYNERQRMETMKLQAFYAQTLGHLRPEQLNPSMNQATSAPNATYGVGHSYDADVHKQHAHSPATPAVPMPYSYYPNGQQDDHPRQKHGYNGQYSSAAPPAYPTPGRGPAQAHATKGRRNSGDILPDYESQMPRRSTHY